MNTVRARVWRFQLQTGGRVRATVVRRGDLPVGLARLVHVNAMACDLRRVLDYRTKELEANLLLSYIDAPGGGTPLQLDHHALDASSRHIRCFVSECAGLGMLTAASEAIFAWEEGTDPLHSFDALPKQLPQVYKNKGVRPDLLFQLPAGPVAGEARGRYRKQALLPKKPLADQKKRLSQLAAWSTDHADHSYFMSWVYVGPSGVAVDIFLPESDEWDDDALVEGWAEEEQDEGQEHVFDLHEAPRDPEPLADIDALGPAEAEGDGGPWTAPMEIARPLLHTGEPVRTPQEHAEEVVTRLYESAPEPDAGATVAGIAVRGRWVAADALGPARHEVLLGVLAERPPRQVNVRERMARSDGRFDACLDGRLLTVVRPLATPRPEWHELERVLLGDR
ncbi:hypothetical protein ACFWC9_01085 [Streptomyces goshikiensis]|uniref:hypothetical protein n=1 Tax=Streptomyces goshikiensis TaxID=1942 RepID=UPI0036BACD1E